MITDKETNTIYFSEKLKEKFPDTANKIFSTLNLLGTIPAFLYETNDIWVRDYMPVQVSDSKFIECRYDPDYLQGKEKGCLDLKTYPDMVCDKLGLKTVKSDLILDGDNVVKSSNSVILTDKVVVENKHKYRKDQLINDLRKLFEVEKVVF